MKKLIKKEEVLERAVIGGGLLALTAGVVACVCEFVWLRAHVDLR